MKHRNFLIALFISLVTKSYGQGKTERYIETGKTLIELIKIFKTPRTSANSDNSKSVDSCGIKQKSDLCFKNSTFKDLTISLYKRTDTAYSEKPFTMVVLASRVECWYDLKAGIYKYRIEIENGQGKTVYREGELKLQPCENMQREIKE